MAKQKITINHITTLLIDADGAIHSGQAVVTTILDQPSQPSGVTLPLSMEPTQ